MCLKTGEYIINHKDKYHELFIKDVDQISFSRVLHNITVTEWSTKEVKSLFKHMLKSMRFRAFFDCH